jgi:hypothetical protein
VHSATLLIKDQVSIEGSGVFAVPLFSTGTAAYLLSGAGGLVLNKHPARVSKEWTMGIEISQSNGTSGYLFAKTGATGKFLHRYYALYSTTDKVVLYYRHASGAASLRFKTSINDGTKMQVILAVKGKRARLIVQRSDGSAPTILTKTLKGEIEDCEGPSTECVFTMGERRRSDGSNNGAYFFVGTFFGVRCSFFDGNLHARIPLVHMLARVKRAGVWPMPLSNPRIFTLLPFNTVHCVQTFKATMVSNKHIEQYPTASAVATTAADVEAVIAEGSQMDLWLDSNNHVGDAAERDGAYFFTGRGEVLKVTEHAAVRCTFSRQRFTSRMSLIPTPARLKRTCVRPIAFLSGVHCSYRCHHELCRNTEGAELNGHRNRFDNSSPGQCVRCSSFSSSQSRLCSA